VIPQKTTNYKREKKKKQKRKEEEEEEECGETRKNIRIEYM
jgi:hypothetical protein